MAVPWLVILEDFERAPHHVQVEISGFQRSKLFRAHVTATVVRSFKGDAALVGQQLTLSMACLGPGGEALIGADFQVHLLELQKIRFMEMFLPSAPEGEGPVAPLYSYSITLEAPTDAPVFDVQAELQKQRLVLQEMELEQRSAARRDVVQAILTFVLLGLAAIWFFTLSGLALWAWHIGAPALILYRLLFKPTGQRIPVGSWALLVVLIPTVMGAVIADAVTR